MHDCLEKGHEVYLNRHYSSIPLFLDLFLHKTVAVGTCMFNRRGLPKDFIRQKLSTGGVLACRRESLLALKWKDKCDVLMLSTKHTSSMEAVSVRAPGGRIVKNEPTVVQEYNPIHIRR